MNHVTSGTARGLHGQHEVLVLLQGTVSAYISLVYVGRRMHPLLEIHLITSRAQYELQATNRYPVALLVSSSPSACGERIVVLRGATTGPIALRTSAWIHALRTLVLRPVAMVDRYTIHQYRPQLLSGTTWCCGVSRDSHSKHCTLAARTSLASYQC